MGDDWFGFKTDNHTTLHYTALHRTATQRNATQRNATQRNAMQYNTYWFIEKATYGFLFTCCNKLTQQVDAELFEIMPKFQILQVKREITFNSNNKWKSLCLSNFPRAAIFDFMTCHGCRYCLEAEDLLCETIGQPLHVIKYTQRLKNLKKTNLRFQTKSKTK